MAKRRMAVIAILLCFCLWLVPCRATAASTTDALQPINVEKECVLTLSYTCNETAFKNVPVKLYKIADVSADFQYILTSRFEASQLILNGVQSAGEWKAIRSTIEAYILADNIAADSTAKTNSNGQACFETLKPGLYIAAVDTLSQEGLTCRFDSALVALPGLNTGNIWQYDVSVASKSKIIPPVDEEMELKVTKLWKGDESKKIRPDSIEVEIFKNGISHIKTVLSNENNWSYSWSAKDDGAKWTVIERNIPSGYVMTVEQRDTSFVLINTYNPKNPGDPFDAPETGDTSTIMLYVILMIISGGMLIILGIIGKRKAHEDNK